MRYKENLHIHLYHKASSSPQFENFFILPYYQNPLLSIFIAYITIPQITIIFNKIRQSSS